MQQFQGPVWSLHSSAPWTCDGGIVIALVAYFVGIDPAPLLEMTQPAGGGSSVREAPRGAPADETGQFVSKVLGSTEDVWSGIFQRSGSEYRAPTLVLYEGQVRSACGMGQAAMGPFYCRATRSSTSTSRSSATCTRGFARRGTSPRPT